MNRSRSSSLAIITGFLGSGKTTLINKLLAMPSMADCAVIVNELGDVGIDHDLIIEHHGDSVVVSGGCMCCSMRGSVVETVARVLQAGKRPVQRLFLEASGVADPLPILSALAASPDLAGRLSAPRLVTVVDALLGSATLARHEEARRQVALADSLLLSKSDLGSPHDHAATRRLARDLNSQAPMHEMNHGQLPGSTVRELFESDDTIGRFRLEAQLGSDDDARHPGAHGDGFVSASVRFGGQLPPFALDAWLDDLLSCFGGHILRIKGLLRIAGIDGPVVLHGVQHIVAAPRILPVWPGSDENSRIVVIAQGMDVSLLDDSLRWLRSQASNGSLIACDGVDNAAKFTAAGATNTDRAAQRQHQTR